MMTHLRHSQKSRIQTFSKRLSTLTEILRKIPGKSQEPVVGI